MTDELHFTTTASGCGREDCACTNTRVSTGSETNSDSDSDSDMSQNAPTDEEIVQMTEEMEEKILQKVDEIEEMMHENARALGVDPDELGSNTSERGSSASGSGSTDVSLTANTKRVATEHGLPTDWFALDGIDLPPSLADVPMSDKGLATAINRAHGVTSPGDRIVTAQLVANTRDKGIDPGSPGVSVTDLAANSDEADAGGDLDAEQPLPASTVTNRVESHLSRTGQETMGNSAGVSLEDVDEASGD